MHFEATIAITHHVRRVVVGNRVIRLKSSDVTNVNVMAKLQVYVRAPNWTFAYAGPSDAATVVVVIIRGGEVWKDSRTRLDARLAEVTRLLGRPCGRTDFNALTRASTGLGSWLTEVGLSSGVGEAVVNDPVIRERLRAWYECGDPVWMAVDSLRLTAKYRG